jgi:hypothetical protein
LNPQITLDLQIANRAKMAKDLLDMIDFSNLECLNEKPQHPAANGGREQLLSAVGVSLAWRLTAAM